ncbi:arf-GAP with dual PH domain-containing protein 2 [Synchiropus picturatus]
MKTCVMASHGQNERVLLELVKQPENSVCADCGAPDPDWASCNLGLFVCLNCSGVHRNFSHRVRSIKLDLWEDDLVEFMKSKGNICAKALYEKAVPPYYYRPQPSDCSVLREQWIRAKYERTEFNGETKYPPPAYTTGFYEGTLWKKGKDKMQFLKRKFVLSQRDRVLTYFNKEDEFKGPKAVIPIKDLNATFQPEKIGHPNGLQLSYQCNNRTRNLYVYHESAEVVVTWFNAIRAARYVYLQDTYPTLSGAELVPKITWDFLKQGYMEKTGPLKTEAFKKRWFVLDAVSRQLLYYKDQLDAEELGVIFIGLENKGYSARRCIPKHSKWSKWKCGITLETPARKYVFMCEQDREQIEWLDALRDVMSTPMSPEDYTTAATIQLQRQTI